jgi:hypothetical protein
MRDRDDDGDGFTTISETVRYTDPVTGKNIITNIIRCGRQSGYTI